MGATANPTKSDKKMKKGATGQSFICKEVTSYKIHTLVWRSIEMSKVGISRSTVNLITEKYDLQSSNLLIAGISHSNKYVSGLSDSTDK